MHTGFFVEKPEGKGPIAGHKRRLEDTVKMDLEEIRWADVDWINQAQDRDKWRALVIVVVNFVVL